MPQAKIKTTPATGVIFMVVAHRVQSGRTGNAIFIELFKKKDAAQMWKEQVESEGFVATLQRKGVH